MSFTLPDHLKMHLMGARYIIKAMRAAGYVPKIEDQDGDTVRSFAGPGALDKYMDAMFEADDCRVFFYKTGSPTESCYFIWSNDADEIVCDCSAFGIIDKVSSDWSEHYYAKYA